MDKESAVLTLRNIDDIAQKPNPAEVPEKRNPFLEGPILPSLLKLAAPTILVMAVQSLLTLIEVYFVSSLGTDAVAGVTLVFPVQMVMISVASGAIGGGVSSAIARAMGAGKKEEASTLALHAFVLAIAFGLVFTIANWLCAPALFRALGGSGAVLDAALSYSNMLFSGAVFAWIVALLPAALRGGGNAKVPAAITLGVALVTVPLSPLLIVGWGPVPSLGVAGAALAVVMHCVVSGVLMVRYMRSGKSNVALPFSFRTIERRFFAAILRVGGLSILGTVQANLTVILVTAVVGYFGAQAIAAYGIASRLDYILMPMVFGLGTAVLAMVGMNVGAGNLERAQKIARRAALTAGLVTEVIGLLIMAFSREWMAVFSKSPAVIDSGALYLHTVGPVYGFFGIAMTAYFAGQGAGRVVVPTLAGTARLCIAAIGGWCVVKIFGGGIDALFKTVAVSYFVAGSAGALFLLMKWEPRR